MEHAYARALGYAKVVLVQPGSPACGVSKDFALTRVEPLAADAAAPAIVIPIAARVFFRRVKLE